MKKHIETARAHCLEVWAALRQAIGLHFDPDADGLPPLAAPEKKAPKPRVRGEKDVVHVVQGRRFRETVADGVVEWENISGKTSANADRQPTLTEFDYVELDRRDLDDEKAWMLKPFWSQGATASGIVALLNGDAKRYGLGQRTVEGYVAAFNAALSAEQGQD